MIAYVHMYMSRLAGVEGASSGQARAAVRLGLPLQTVIISPDREGEENGIRYLRLEEPWSDRTASLERKLFRYRALAATLSRIEADALVLRYVPALDLDPMALFRKLSRPIFTVHHAKEERELLGVGLRPGMVGRAILEGINSRRVLRRVSGLLGVTDEIRQYELAKLRAPIPSSTIPNGVDVESVPFTGFRRFDGSELSMILVASAFAPWHGVDRLLGALARYRGATRIKLHVVGQTDPALFGALDRNKVELVLHGVRRGAELDAIFRDCHLAISTLAMFRNQLRQAAVLKTREYIARGIPFVLGYEDVDLPSSCKFALQVSGDERPFEIDEILQFVQGLEREADLAHEMRAFASEHLDWGTKLTSLVKFVSSVPHA